MFAQEKRKAGLQWGGRQKEAVKVTERPEETVLDWKKGCMLFSECLSDEQHRSEEGWWCDGGGQIKEKEKSLLHVRKSTSLFCVLLSSSPCVCCYVLVSLFFVLFDFVSFFYATVVSVCSTFDWTAFINPDGTTYSIFCRWSAVLLSRLHLN